MRTVSERWRRCQFSARSSRFLAGKIILQTASLPGAVRALAPRKLNLAVSVFVVSARMLPLGNDAPWKYSGDQ
jgi:hypothetical protein